MSSEEAITKPNPDGQGAEDASQGKPPRPSPSQEELAAMDPADARAILELGIARAATIGDEHARGEMQEFLASL